MEIEEAVRGGSSSRGSGSRRQRRGGRGGSRGGVPDNDWDETSERLILDENGYQTLRSRRRVSLFLGPAIPHTADLRDLRHHPKIYTRHGLVSFLKLDSIFCFCFVNFIMLICLVLSGT